MFINIFQGVSAAKKNSVQITAFEEAHEKYSRFKKTLKMEWNYKINLIHFSG
jgi:16S rRNA G527 N7-methylase RsmG